MPVQIAVILAFACGWWSGMAWIRASRLDRNDRLAKTVIAQRQTIAELREELGEQRRTDLFEWLFKDDRAAPPKYVGDTYWGSQELITYRPPEDES